MEITSYSELSPLGQIVFMKYKKSTITQDQINELLKINKLTIDEVNFISKIGELP
jgi:hypothetical protein